MRLSEKRRAEALGFMDRLEQTLRRWPCRARAACHGAADVVWTVFLARMEFVGLGAELQKRPALARYWRAMQTRPSFAPADIWTKLHAFRLIGGMLGIG